MQAADWRLESKYLTTPSCSSICHNCHWLSATCSDIDGLSVINRQILKSRERSSAPRLIYYNSRMIAKRLMHMRRVCVSYDEYRNNNESNWKCYTFTTNYNAAPTPTVPLHNHLDSTRRLFWKLIINVIVIVRYVNRITSLCAHFPSTLSLLYTHHSPCFICRVNEYKLEADHKVLGLIKRRSSQRGAPRLLLKILWIMKRFSLSPKSERRKLIHFAVTLIAPSSSC